VALFRKKTKNDGQTNIADAPDLGDEGWQRLRSRCLPVSAARQRRLIESGAGGAWTLDLEAGVASIGGQRTSIQVLGNSSTSGASFMFGWRLSELNGFDPKLAEAAVRARNAAGADGEGIFSEDARSTVDVDEAELASVMSVLGSEAPMYRGPHGNGAVYFTLEDFKIDEALPTEAVLTVAAESIGLGLLDGASAMRALFVCEGFSVKATAAGLTAERDGDVVQVTLDEVGRVKNLEGELRPRPS
jgi:hypothetical protein